MEKIIQYYIQFQLYAGIALALLILFTAAFTRNKRLKKQIPAMHFFSWLCASSLVFGWHSLYLAPIFTLLTYLLFTFFAGTLLIVFNLVLHLYIGYQLLGWYGLLFGWLTAILSIALLKRLGVDFDKKESDF
jgi:hypothetical protein